MTITFLYLQDSVIKSEQTGEKEIVNEFGAFLDLPILPTMEEVGVEVTAIAGLTDFFVQIKKTTEQSVSLFSTAAVQ